MAVLLKIPANHVVRSGKSLKVVQGRCRLKYCNYFGGSISQVAVGQNGGGSDEYRKLR